MLRKMISIVPAVWFLAGAFCVSANPAESITISQQVDQLVEDACVKDNVAIGEVTTDTEFLRRTWLDLAGRTPPLTDVTKIASGTKIDREELVQRLLDSSEFTINMTENVNRQRILRLEALRHLEHFRGLLEPGCG